jgi:hypothetical protein
MIAVRRLTCITTVLALSWFCGWAHAAHSCVEEARELPFTDQYTSQLAYHARKLPQLSEPYGLGDWPEGVQAEALNATRVQAWRDCLASTPSRSWHGCDLRRFMYRYIIVNSTVHVEHDHFRPSPAQYFREVFKRDGGAGCMAVPRLPRR